MTPYFFRVSFIAKGRRQKAEGFYVYYWYVVVWAVKESPDLYGGSYIS
jgi:hypothetical protein